MVGSDGTRPGTQISPTPTPGKNKGPLVLPAAEAGAGITFHPLRGHMPHVRHDVGMQAADPLSAFHSDV